MLQGTAVEKPVGYGGRCCKVLQSRSQWAVEKPVGCGGRCCKVVQSRSQWAVAVDVAR